VLGISSYEKLIRWILLSIWGGITYLKLELYLQRSMLLLLVVIFIVIPQDVRNMVYLIRWIIKKSSQLLYCGLSSIGFRW
jgi:hypothetical protein